MKKYKVLVLVIVALGLCAGNAFAQDNNGPGFKASLLVFTGYQFSLQQLQGDISSAAGIDEFLEHASRFSVGLGFQMVFPIGETLGLGFEVGAKVPLIASIASFANAVSAPTHSLQAVHILPKAIFQIGYDDVLSLDILLGANINLMRLVELSFANVTFDVETRLNLALSSSFALYAGLNYALPLNLTLSAVQNDLNEYWQNALTPSIGVRITL